MPASRFLKRFTLAAAFAALLLPASSALAQKPEKPNVRIAIGGKIGFFYLPVSVAEGLGYFKEEGLEPEFSDLAGGAKALQALVGGSADVTSGAYEHTVQMAAKNIKLKAFVLQGAYTDIALGIVKKKIPNYKSAADLKGKKYGVTSPGSATDFFVKHQMIKAGLKPEDAAVVGIGQTSAAIAAIQTGELDAVANVDPVMTELEMKGLVEIVADGRTVEGSQAIFGGSFPAGSLYAKEEFIKANPNTVQALTNAIVRALIWMKTATPEQVAEKLPPQFVSGNREVVLAALKKTLPTYSRDGLIPRDGAEIVLKVQAEIDPAVRDAKINLADTFDNSFAQKAMAKYGNK